MALLNYFVSGLEGMANILCQFPTAEHTLAGGIPRLFIQSAPTQAIAVY
jgi:hypothetical protein